MVNTVALAPTFPRVEVRRRSAWRWDLAAIVLVVVVQIVYFTGVIASDDFQYLEAALRSGAGQPMSQGEPYIYARFVHWRLIQAAAAILPRQPWAMVLPSLLATLVVLLTLRAFARDYLSPRMAVVPVLVCGLVPVNVILASVALPEPIATAFGWCGVYLAAGPLLERAAPRAVWSCVAGGLLIAVGYNAKEIVAVFVPGLILFVLLCRTRCPWAWRRVALVAAGSAMWVAGEMLAMALWYGDPLARLHAVSATHQVFGAAPVEYTPGGLTHHATEYLRWLADPRGDFGPMGLVLLAGLVYALVKRTPISNLLLCVVLPPLIYLSVGSTDLRDYRPVVHQTRYLAPLLPGMALLSALMLRQLWQAGPRPRRAVTIVAPLIAAFCLIAPNRLAGRWYGAEVFSAGYPLVSQSRDALEPTTRLCASAVSSHRFTLLPHWLDCPEVEMVYPPPTTQDEWVDRYGGAVVITTRADRRGASRPKHQHLTLQGPAMASLTRFACVGRREPPRDRLCTLWARVLGRPVPTDPEQAVELWYVPTPAEWRDARPAPQPIPPG